MILIRWPCRVVAVGWFLSCSSFVQAQETVLLDACPSSKSIEMQLAQSIAGVEDPPRIGDSEVYARDSRGRILTFFFDAPGIVSVFGSSGLLEATLTVADDELAAGALEVLSGIVVTPGDTIHLFDRGRTTRWTFSPSFELIGRVSLPGRPHWGSQIRVPSGEWVISADIRTEAAVGWPLHVLDSSGEVSTSFGTDLRVYRQDLPALVQRLIAPAEDGRIWSAHVNEYRVELWGPDNSLVRTLVRDPSWFEPWTTQVGISVDIPRHPYVQDIAVDESGRLWLLILKASERYREFVSEFSPGAFTWTSPDAYHSSVVEVIDPFAGCVVASLETEVFLKRSLGGGQYAAYAFRDETRFLDIWSLRVAR